MLSGVRLPPVAGQGRVPEKGTMWPVDGVKLSRILRNLASRGKPVDLLAYVGIPREGLPRLDQVG